MVKVLINFLYFVDINEIVSLSHNFSFSKLNIFNNFPKFYQSLLFQHNNYV